MRRFGKLGLLLVLAVSVMLLFGLLPAAAQAAGSISGKVTNAAGSPLSAGWIYANPVDTTGNYDQTRYGASAAPDGNGNYQITGLAAGGYKVEFFGYTGYLNGYYNNKFTWWSADMVSVMDNQDASNINAVLQVGGSISGTVTDASGNPISGAWVSANAVTASGTYDPTRYGGSAATDANGNYKITGLAAGDYTVRFSASAYATTLYSGPVNVTQGQDAPNINASLETGGSISGMVTDSLGGPVSGAWVNAIPVDANGNADSTRSSVNASTDSQGYYQIMGLSTGGYVVSFSNYGSNYVSVYYNNTLVRGDAEIVSVTQGQDTPDINATMPTGGSISGTVTDASGNPISGVTVTARLVDAAGNPVRLRPFRRTTDASGNYTLLNMPAGSFRVKFSPPSGSYYLTEYYNNIISTWSSADLVAVTEGEQTPNINAQLQMGAGSISGRVTDANGDPVSRATVCAVAVDANGNPLYTNGNYDYVRNLNDSVHVGGTNQGAYRIDGLDPGTYKVIFTNGPQSLNTTYFLTQYYNNQSVWGGAEIVTVAQGQTIANVDAALQTGAGNISGRVTDANGDPIVGAVVAVTPVDASGNRDLTRDEHKGFTDSNGAYQFIAGLTPGAYKVKFSKSGSNYLPAYYSGKSDWDTADKVNITTGQITTNINGVLQISPTSALIGPAPTGSSVTVDLGGGTKLSFDDVASAGEASVVSITPDVPAPANFSIVGGLYYDISTTAIYSGYITITLPYNPDNLTGPETDLKLFHWEDGVWQDVTVSVDTVNNTITGKTTSLSPFTIASPSSGSGEPAPAAVPSSSIWTLALMGLTGIALVRRKLHAKQV